MSLEKDRVQEFVRNLYIFAGLTQYIKIYKAVKQIWLIMDVTRLTLKSQCHFSVSGDGTLWWI